MYSTIKHKCKGENCENKPVLGLKGFCWSCVPEDIKKAAGDKKKLQQKRFNARKYASVKLRSEKRKEDTELELWFRARRLEMTGVCQMTGLKTSKDDDKNYKSSICHIFLKSKIKSVATHKDNWVELNFWDGVHTTFDNMGYEYCKEKHPEFWKLLVEKAKKVYSSIIESERKHIPEVLLNEL